MTLLYLLRHGESEWNRKRLMQGHADPPLTEQGARQARRARGFFAGITFDTVFSSDLLRARRTAELAGYADAVPDPVWREVNIGEWQGRRFEDLTRREQSQYACWRSGDYTPEGGESWTAFEQRVAHGIAALVGPENAALVVCHGGVVRAAVASVLGVPATSLETPAPCSVTVLRVAEAPCLLGYNMAERINGVSSLP